MNQHNPWRSNAQPIFGGPQTIPGQIPTNSLMGYWSGGPFIIAEPGINTGSVWQSPIFDMRPALKAVQGENPPLICQPIGPSSNGTTVKFYVAFTTTAADMVNSMISARRFDIEATELGSLDDPNDMRVLDQVQSIAPAVLSGGQRAIVSWVPAGCRYWRVQLTFTQRLGGAVIGDTTIAAAVY
tara:strand:- start:830 stop:1381 length:552 start_codon:yes stop_codon:yes gene_type:complete